MSKRAVVLLSGGLDSATCVYIAKSQGFEIYALSFDYGQRCQVELNSAAQVCAAAVVREQRIFHLDIDQFGGSALTDLNIDVPETMSAAIPITYVPARNTIFLSIALGWAEVLGARDIFIGANDVDYSGYPDCRPEFLQAFNTTANLATKAGVSDDPFTIHAPLLNLSKADIIRTGVDLGLDYSITCSCYQGDQAGRACGKCESCQIRRDGFIAAGVADPTVYLPETI